MKLDQDDFDEWQAHPITEALMVVCRVWAEEAKTHWLRVSWDGEQPDPITLAKLKERAAVLEEIRALTPDKIEEVIA